MVRLIVSAWEPEQQWLRKSWDSEPHPDRVEFHLLGIGPLSAAARLSKLLAQHAAIEGASVREVIFVGTAGSYSEQKAPLKSVVCSDSVWFSEGGAISGQSYFPAQVVQNAIHFRGALPPEVLSDGPALPSVCSVCVPSVTSSETLAEAFLQLGDVENLELAGVAEACLTYGVPWWSVLGVSNLVGPRGHEEWKLNQQEVSFLAQKKLLSYLKKRSP